MATELAKKEGADGKTRFLEFDAEKLNEAHLGSLFDVVWICEVREHLFAKRKYILIFPC